MKRAIDILPVALRRLGPALVLTLAACATGPQGLARDPIEPVNREVFAFNEAFDKGVMQPIARAYNHLLPEPVRLAVGNFFSNIGDVYSAINNLLQGKPVAAVEDTMRVTINTVFGLGGLIDIATPAGLPKYGEDFGQTLGVWGLPSGPYLVLPFLGPSSVRDTTGLFVDRVWDPQFFLINDQTALYGLLGLRIVDLRARLLEATQIVEEAALDKYSFVRDAYLQRRRYLVYDGDPPEQNNDMDDSDGTEPDSDGANHSALPQDQPASNLSGVHSSPSR